MECRLDDDVEEEVFGEVESTPEFVVVVNGDALPRRSADLNGVLADAGVTLADDGDDGDGDDNDGDDGGNSLPLSMPSFAGSTSTLFSTFSLSSLSSTSKTSVGVGSAPAAASPSERLNRNSKK